MAEKNVEKMGQAFEPVDERKVILDTSICIEILKSNQNISGYFESLSLMVPYISSVTMFELMFRTHNVKEAEDFIADAEVLSFDDRSARKTSEIALELKRKGMPIETPDIFIAAIAMANNCKLLTLNTKDFSKIKGLKLVKLH